MTRLGLWLTVSSLGLALPDLAHAEPLHADGRYFRDARGGMVLLRGVNVAGDSKVPPFRPVDDVAMFDRLAEYGVNSARLLFTWEAFESERGTYDESYFDYYRGLVDALHARGIRVIVDFHQDAFSRFSTDGCGEGMPAWAISTAVTPDTPDNGPNCAGWGIKFILDGDTHRSWDDFYADANGVRTSYLNLLDLVSQRLGQHEGVIGYDMLNEPWGDEVKQIGPLYVDAARVLRAHDEDAILFTSPQALTSSGQDTKLERPTYTNFVYSPHYYDGAVIMLHRWLGGSLADPVQRMFDRAQAWEVPLLVGEFGAPGDGENVGPYMEEFYAQLDARFISATQWSFVAHWDETKKDGWNTEDFAIFKLDGSPRATYRLRPYPARVAGEPLSFAVATEPRSVSFSWSHDPSLGETRLFAPFLPLFSGQAFVETPDDVACSYEVDRRHLRCTAESAGDKHIVLRACGGGEPCVQTEAPPPAVDDAGAPPPEPVDAGATEPPQEDAGGGSVVAPSVDPRSGCDLSHGGRPASWLAALGALALLGKRRRRAS